MAVSDVNTQMTLAQSALADGDYTTALQHAIAAQGYLSTLPNSRRSADSLEWDDRKIESFIANVRKLQTGSAGVQYTKITRARTSAS